MTEDNLLIEIKSIMAAELEVSADQIPDNANINDFEKWDSMNHISILFALENKYGIEINEEQIQHLTTLQNIYNYVKQKQHG